MRLGLDSDVEKDRAVERRLLAQQQMGQFGVEGVALLGVAEVVLLLAPSGDRVDHAQDKLAHAGLAPRTAQRTAEVLGRDHVGGGLRPVARNLDVALLEDHPAVLAGDYRRAVLPFDLVHRIDAGAGEEAAQVDTLPLGVHHHFGSV